MTERELICLTFLSDKMEATAAMIGKAIYEQVSSRHRGRGSNLAAIGANVVGALRKRGLVMRVPELNAWQITVAGRELLDDLALSEASVMDVGRCLDAEELADTRRHSGALRSRS